MRSACFALLVLALWTLPVRADDPAPAAPPVAPEAPQAPATPEAPPVDPTLLPAPEAGKVSLYAAVDVEPQGDADGRVEIHFAEADYAHVKEASPDPRKFLQDLRSSRVDYEIGPDPTAAYDDQAHAVVLLMRELGACRHLGGGAWAIPVEQGGEMLAGDPVEGRLRAVFATEGTWGNGVRFEGRLIYTLPAGATDANWDGTTKLLTWKLALPAPTGPAAVTLELKRKDRLMTTIYKVYGLGSDLTAQWVAKAVLRNTGGSVAKGLRLRFRLDRYSEWSAWTKVGDVVPGQTVSVPYYPVLDAAIAKLRSNTPADLRVEWNFTDSQGAKQEDDAAGRLVLLGGGEFVFSNLIAGESFGTWQEGFNNAPLLAAWVSRDDPVVKRMAAMANRLAGGLGASTDDASAVKVLAACYDLLRANDFTYQHPATLADKSISFDVRQVQHVKLPRDVVRDRSGTCIDLAILLASMGNALGLEPHLALIPGHCFPVFRLPGGNLLGLESTGVAGGLRHGSADAATMIEKGNEELKAAFEDGRIYLIDLRSLWTQGISNPELDELPADILEKWGIREEGRTGTEGPAKPAAGDLFPGLFGGTVTETDEEGETLTYPVRIGIDAAGPGRYTAVLRADLQIEGADGPQTMVLLEQAEGEKRGDELVMRCTARKLTNAATGESQDLPTQNRLIARIEKERLVGKHGNDEEGWTEFSFARDTK